MTLNLWCQELIAFVFYFLYASFFEWWFHKYLFHSPRLIRHTFKHHQLVHHQRYKFEPSSYEVQEGQEREHIAMDWFALPLFEGVHLPLFYLVQHLTGWQSLWGGVGAIMAYYCLYEFSHYTMHVPTGHRFENLRCFAFAKEHHRIHHKYMQQNLNVFFPLADKCLGTFRSAASSAASQPTALATPRPTATPAVVIKPLPLGE
jgi:hypothetical protein